MDDFVEKYVGKGQFNIDQLAWILNQADPEAKLFFISAKYHVTVFLRTFRFVGVRLGRVDEAPMGWEELQAVKNELIGEDRWAFQMFPPKVNEVNVANGYHLCVYPRGKRPKVGRLPAGEDLSLPKVENICFDSAQQGHVVEQT